MNAASSDAARGPGSKLTAGEGDLTVRPSRETPLLPCGVRAPLPNLIGGGGEWSLA